MTSKRTELERFEGGVFGVPISMPYLVQVRDFLEMQLLRVTDRKRYNGDHRRWMHEARLAKVFHHERPRSYGRSWLADLLERCKVVEHLDFGGQSPGHPQRQGRAKGGHVMRQSARKRAPFGHGAEDQEGLRRASRESAGERLATNSQSDYLPRAGDFGSAPLGRIEQVQGAGELSAGAVGIGGRVGP